MNLLTYLHRAGRWVCSTARQRCQSVDGNCPRHCRH